MDCVVKHSESHVRKYSELVTFTARSPSLHLSIRWGTNFNGRAGESTPRYTQTDHPWYLRYALKPTSESTHSRSGLKDLASNTDTVDGSLSPYVSLDSHDII